MVERLAPGGRLYPEMPSQLFEDRISNERVWPNGLHNHDHWWAFSERTLRTWFENLGLVDIGFANTTRPASSLSVVELVFNPSSNVHAS